MKPRSPTVQTPGRHHGAHACVAYTGARTLRLQPIAAEPPGPGLVRIDVAYPGICGTDLHIYHGDMDGWLGR